MSQEESLEPPVMPTTLAHYREGRRLHQARDFAGAVREFQAAAREAPDHPDILEALAIAAAEGGDPVSAEAIMRHAATLDPSPARIARRALIVHRLGRYAEAVALFTDALPRLPFVPALYDTFVQALERNREYDRALSIVSQIHEKAPTVEHAAKLAVAMLRQGRIDLMQQIMPGLLARWPQSTILLDAAGVMALGSGDFPAGFAYLRRRHELDRAAGARGPFADIPVWDGQRFDGTLLVTTEPHLGEEIQVSALLGALKMRGLRVAAEIDARLLPLFGRTWPEFTFVARGSGELPALCADGRACRRAASLDLMQLLDRRFTLPGPPGWLAVDAARVARLRAEYRARWPGRTLVGINWYSRQVIGNGDLKGIPLASLPRTLALDNCVFVCQQYGDVSAELAALETAGLPRPWIDPGIDTTNDIDGLAAQMVALDHVVSISSSTAHLAGAVGAPTTVLLPRRYPILWHWGFAGEQATWYGSVRLLRNPADDGWVDVDAELARRLSALSPG